MSESFDAFSPFLFLVGAPRSGTKLLRQLLNQSDQIYIIENETDIYPALVRFFDNDDLSEGWFDRLFAELSGTKFFLRRRDMGRPILKEEWSFLISRPTPASVFAALIEVAADGISTTETKVLGDKSPLHIECVGRLLLDFPEGKVIHLVRDGREVALSSASAWGKSPLRAIQKWTDTTMSAEKMGSEYPDRFLRVRYEDLIADPVCVVRAISRFLDVEFSSRMLSLDVTAENLGRASGLTKISAPEFSRSSVVDAKLLRRMEEVFLPAASCFGYKLLSDVADSRRLSRVESAFLSIGDFVSLTAFHIRELGFFAGIQYAFSRRKLF